jgi:hypothetical protein
MLIPLPIRAIKINRITIPEYCFSKLKILGLRFLSLADREKDLSIHAGPI